MAKSLKRDAWLTAAVFFCASAIALAHDPKKKSSTMGIMDGCGEHHAAAMKASDDVSMHLAEAKRSSTLSEMRTHVEAADKAMTDMKNHMSMCMEMMNKTQGGMASPTTTGATAAEVVDPVCGMEVADAKTAPSATYKGKTYYFCSEEDKAKFQKNPEQYASKKL